MDYTFDQEHLQEIGRTNVTVVTMTDYVRRNEVYNGPLNDTCFEMINFYLENGWLDNVKWTKSEKYLENGWKELITDAVDEKGEELFNITVLIKGKKFEIPMPQVERKVPWFWLGVLSAFVPIHVLLEGIGIGALFNHFFNKK